MTPHRYGALKPIVLIAGGTGYVDLPTGKSPEVLNSAEIYDPALRRFLPIAPMNERRDQFAATAVGDGQGSDRRRYQHSAGSFERISRAGNALDFAFR